jgi:hypothetical protein
MTDCEDTLSRDIKVGDSIVIATDSIIKATSKKMFQFTSISPATKQ